MTAFIAGAVAFPVIVNRVDPISSGRILVQPARLVVNNTQWLVEAQSSTVVGVDLLVKNTDTGANHTYFITVQVSCLTFGFYGFRQPFICTSGSAFTPLLRPGQSTHVVVFFDFAIAPELTQIEDLSFIVQEFRA